jgi:3-methyladenine DNA glycosylase AlkD
MAFTPMAREGRFLTDAFSVAELLMNDPDPQVQAGVGTLLLEAARMQPERVVEFLKPLKDKAPASIVRTATSKMQPGHRSAILGA